MMNKKKMKKKTKKRRKKKIRNGAYLIFNLK